jgi:hypothetical protein
MLVSNSKNLHGIGDMQKHQNIKALVTKTKIVKMPIDSAEIQTSLKTVQQIGIVTQVIVQTTHMQQLNTLIHIHTEVNNTHMHDVIMDVIIIHRQDVIIQQETEQQVSDSNKQVIMQHVDTQHGELIIQHIKLVHKQVEIKQESLVAQIEQAHKTQQHD